MTAPNAPEPKELVTSRAKGPAPKPKWRTRVSARAIGLWLVVGGLSVLFAIIAVAVALAQIRAFQPTTLGVAVLFLAPIGGAICTPEAWVERRSRGRRPWRPHAGARADSGPSLRQWRTAS